MMRGQPRSVLPLYPVEVVRSVIVCSNLIIAAHACTRSAFHCIDAERRRKAKKLDTKSQVSMLRMNVICYLIVLLDTLSAGHVCMYVCSFSVDCVSQDGNPERCTSTLRRFSSRNEATNGRAGEVRRDLTQRISIRNLTRSSYSRLILSYRITWIECPGERFD